MPRYHRVEDIIQLALALQTPGRGLCLEDIQRRFGVGRRTAERMREAVDRLYPGMTSTKDSDGRKYWRLPGGEANALVAWRPEELEALSGAIHDAETAGDLERARALASVHDKVEALSGAEHDTECGASASDVMDGLRSAVLEDRELLLHHHSADEVRVRVRPHGVLGGSRLLLVAVDVDLGLPRLYPVDEIDRVEVLDTTFERDPNVDLRRYAANAFLPFEEDPIDLCWRFAPEHAREVLAYPFHPGQEIEQGRDGSLEVRFRTDSLVELAWHVFAWGDRVESRERPLLKHRFQAMMRRALEAQTLRARDEGPAVAAGSDAG
jgi:predicted DNA-binding transcriptional regulator YafY